MVDLCALRAPFAPHEHNWRAQQVARDGRRAQALCFITARLVQNRLDDVCGPGGWESGFTETASGRVIATISIDMGARWVTKSDGAGATSMEGEKGGMSDAFKRAAVMWGIGRYLYSMPAVWAECEVDRDEAGNPRLRNGKPVWRRWTAQGIEQLENALRQLFARFHAATNTQPVEEPHRVAGRRVQELLPPPDKSPVPFSEAPALKMPPAVRQLVDGLPAAIREGTAEQFWRAHFAQVPQVWHAFAIAEKDRIRREAGR